MVTVHNLNGTGDNSKPKGFTSWKDWWENRKGRRFGKCSKYGCNNNAVHGAHVQKTSYIFGNEWYIVPLCASCNQLSGKQQFEVDDNDLLPVNE